jgi:hypothetical protein
MANVLFELGRQKFLDGFISWSRDDIQVALIDGDDWVENVATDEFFSIIPGGAVVAQSSNFTNKTSTNGVADADDVTLSSVSGDQSELLVIYRAVAAASGTGTSLGTPDGNDIQLITISTGTFVAGHERGYLTISGATGGNNGSFFITEFLTGTTVNVYNPAGANETVAFSWQTDEPLIAYIDTATGLPVTPNGGDITIAWDSGANRIFKL